MRWVKQKRSKRLTSGRQRARERDRQGEGVPLPADVMALDNVTGVSIIERQTDGHDDDELTHDLAMCRELELK